MPPGKTLVFGIAGGIVSGVTYFGIVERSSDPPGTWANALETLNKDASNTVKNTAISFDLVNIRASFIFDGDGLLNSGLAAHLYYSSYSRILA
jgi:hypothetical protein